MSGALLVADGLGEVRFGEPADEALARLVDVLGRQPGEESTITGVTPDGFGGTTVRYVDFGPLSVIINDGRYFRDDEVMHFVGWTLSRAGPADWVTPQGITIGSSVDELRAAFDDQLRLPLDFPSECTGTWGFGVGPTELGFEGELSGAPTDPATTVTSLSAGAQSSC